MTIIPISNTQQLICENSGVPVNSLDISHSMTVVMQKVDLSTGYTFYQCNQSSNTINYMTYQHVYTDQQNMKAGLTNCINNHFKESLLQPIAPGQGFTNMPAIVLGAGLSCKLSGVPLTSTAYRICLTYALPKKFIADQTMNILGEWCATLALAQQSAIANLNSIQAVSL